MVTISVVNTTDDPAKCPSGDGLLGKVTFYAKVAAPRSIQCGEVKWKDPTGVTDLCQESKKGEFFMGGGSLPVNLSAFTATVNKEGIQLFWRTESESNSWGFHLLRSLQEKEGYQQITGEMIRGAGNSTSPREYSYLDNRVENGVTYFYKLQQLDIAGSVQLYGPIQATFSITPTVTPERMRLYANYPNPFNPGTMIQFDLAKEDQVKLEIYDATGKKIRTLVDQVFPAGSHQQSWDGRDDSGKVIANGAYFCRLQTSAEIQIQKMMHLK